MIDKSLNKNLAEGNTMKNIVYVTGPLIIAFIFNMAYNIVDSLWVGNLLGERAIAVITVSAPIIILFTSIGMGWSNSIVVLLSRKIGMKDEADKNRLISTSFIISMVLSIFLVVICQLCTGGILNLFNTPADIYEVAKDFFRIYIIGYIFTLIYLYLTAILRSFGNTTMQMYSIVICTILNIVLDPIFIKLMGIKGAAIATVLSQVTMMLIVIIYIAKKRLFTISFSAYDRKALKELVSKAIPAIIQQSIPAISTGFITAIVNEFGVLAIAGFGISTKLELILLYPSIAFNMAITTCVGQCVGAEKYDEIKEYHKKSILLGSIFLTVCTLLVIIFAGNLVGVFGAGASVKEVVKVYFLIISVGYICNVITNCTLGVINGYGKILIGMCLMLFYYVIIRMPLAYVLSQTNLGLKGAWLAVLISHIVATVVCIICLKVLWNKNKHEIEKVEVG